MKVFDLICELTHFDPYCEIYIKDKSGDLEPFTINDLEWNGIVSEKDKIKDSKYKSSQLYITVKKEIEND